MNKYYLQLFVDDFVTMWYKTTDIKVGGGF